MRDTEPGTVLVLEDDPGVARLERRRLERLGYQVVVAMTVEEAHARIRQDSIDLMVLDYRLKGDVNGLDFYRQLQAEGCDLPTILVTGFSNEPVLVEAIRAGVRDFVPKTPAYLDDLAPAVERIMKQLRTERQVAESEALRESNQQLQRLSEQLVEAGRRKDEFLAMLGHELRNPLAPLAHSLHLLQRQANDPAAVEHARAVMERQVRHLTRLVDDLLDVSRITRGKILLHYEPLDLAALVRATVEDHRPALAAAGLTLTLDLPTEPVRVHGDPTRLAQIVDNLLTNATKFTPAGGRVAVGCRVKGVGGRVPAADSTPDSRHPAPPADSGTLAPTPYPLHPTSAAVVTVTDTGMGMEAEMLARVFETFAQADHSLERSQGGLGLGLSIVKGLVELHGGEVWARSAGPGRGSEFGFSVPLVVRDGGEGASTSPTAVSPGRPVTPSPSRPARVLIIEDNRDAAESLQELLEMDGHEVRVALSGPEGVEVARELRPDVVLCDLGLPGMDGYEVAAALRRDPATAGARLIALTGYGLDSHQERSRGAGFDEHLVKPVDPAVLERLLAPGSG